LDKAQAKILEETPKAQLKTLIVDLGSLKSVRESAKVVLAYDFPIDVLINNAAIMACPYATTVDGFESQFGVNHLGPFLFTNLILPRIFASSSPRIVNVSSLGHRFCPVMFDDVGFSGGKTYDLFLAYGQSKTANILFAKELHNRYHASKGLIAMSLHPGGINTNLDRHVSELSAVEIVDFEGNKFVLDRANYKFKTIPQGTATHIAAAFNPELRHQSGLLMQDCQVDNLLPKPYALDDANAARLWKLSEEMVSQKF